MIYKKKIRNKIKSFKSYLQKEEGGGAMGGSAPMNSAGGGGVAGIGVGPQGEPGVTPGTQNNILMKLRRKKPNQLGEDLGTIDTEYQPFRLSLGSQSNIKKS